MEKGCSTRLRDEVVTEGLPSTAMKYLCKDNDGNIWVSTLRGVGRFRIPALVSTAPSTTELSASPRAAKGAYAFMPETIGSRPSWLLFEIAYPSL